METGCEDSAFDESRKNRLANYCLDNASISVFRLDPEGRILYANRIACSSLGYSQAELLKLSVFDIDPNQSQDAWANSWQELCDAGSVGFESLHQRKDGTNFPIEINATLIEFEGRRYALCLTMDITERKRINELLRINQFAFDKASFGIFLIKEGGEITNVNEHACRYLGYTKEELCRINIFDIDQGIAESDLDPLWAETLDQGVATFETIHRKKDGSDISVEVTGILFDIDGSIIASLLSRILPSEKRPKRTG